MSCEVCLSQLRPKFSIASPSGKSYSLYKCSSCGLWQLHPLPEHNLTELYQGSYFEKRSDRGYDGYASEAVARSVRTTLQKNLQDLNFFEYEQYCEKNLLEIGCAAGHSLAYFTERGWQATGIDIAFSMTEIARQRGLDVITGDFLTHDFAGRTFDLITMWATIEHLPHPGQFIERAAALLKPGGHFYLSTCHTGLFARIYGKNWRYLNVPEHLYYFSEKSLCQLFAASGFAKVKSFTYGSGFTSKPNAGILWRAAKYAADRLAKLGLGDMIVMDFQLKKP